MPEWLVPLIGVLVTAALGYLTFLATRKTGDRDRIAKLEARLDKLEARDSRKSDYIEDLRAHINTGQGPPAPPYPANLFE